MTGRIFAPIFLILAALSLAGCGGGGSDGQPATGDVAVVFTDGPTDRFQRILVSFSAMSLIGPGGHVSLYEGEDITFDLLDMSEWGDLAFNTKVLAGPYNKIRMEVSKIELIDMTMETTVMLDKLPAGGKIDLNPQGQFEVSPDYTTVIKLDMDAKRSFQVVETGNGKLQFRPIVFVEIFQDEIFLQNRLVRVFGTVEAGSIVGADTTGDSSDDSFRLCDLEFLAQTDGPTVSGPTDCVRVYADGAPRVFDATGAEVDFSAVTADQAMTAVGFLVDTNDSGAILGLNSVVLEIGDRQPDVASGWATVQGVVTTDPVACSGGTALCFDFDPDETDPAETVLMQAGTRVFRGDGVELSQSDVSTGDGASIDAVPGATELQAALVVLSNDAGSGGVTGVLDVIGTADDGTTVRLSVTTDIGGTAFVCLDADTDFVHVLVDDETVTILDLLDLGLLETGMQIEAYGDATAPPSGCDFVADLLIAESPPAMH